VINAKGEISPRSAGDSHELQRMLLESEGVVIEKGRIDLGAFRWRPRRGKLNAECRMQK
jgi:alkylated DNA nucleotide flippase Atl1